MAEDNTYRLGHRIRIPNSFSDGSALTGKVNGTASWLDSGGHVVFGYVIELDQASRIHTDAFYVSQLLAHVDSIEDDAR